MKYCIQETISTAKLSITRVLWRDLILELRKRGEGRRESGAFLLARANNCEIIDFICYDDLDPNSYDSGIIVFDGTAYRGLWDYCKSTNCTVIADVHTHPGRWTQQSIADKQHPMIVQQGHISLIVPRFAKGNTRSFRGVGFHEYQGDQQWITFPITKNTFTLI